MRYEYIEPFITSTIRVLDNFIQSDISQGTAILVKGEEIAGDVAIIIRLGGDTEGSIILDMPEITAINICNIMFGEKYTTLTPIGMDSIAELANIIAGSATTVLNDMGFDLTVFPPLVVTKKDRMSNITNVEVFQVPLFTDCGELTMNVALRTN